MKFCTKCISPETLESLNLDEQGVCSVCKQIGFRDDAIDWDERKEMLDTLVEQYKDKGNYDCIVPFSGGKDSAFQVWYVVKELKLKPLVVRFDHWGYRPLMSENNGRIFKILGVDVVQFTPSWHVIRELMKESLKRTGDFCWHCHTGIYGHTMQIALKYNTPLIIWGESIAEYMSYYSYNEMEEVDETRFNRFTNLGITAEDMYEYLGGRVDKRDLYPFAYPNREDLMKMKCRSICLGNYIKWDIKKHVEIIKSELGWQGQDVEGIPSVYDYEKIECKWQGVRDYCKYIKRGYGRTNHLASIDIRNGRMTREEGWKLFKEYDGKRPASLDYMLEMLDMTEDEFVEIVSKSKIAPWEFSKEAVEKSAPLHDMHLWDRTKIDYENKRIKKE